MDSHEGQKATIEIYKVTLWESVASLMSNVKSYNKRQQKM